MEIKKFAEEMKLRLEKKICVVKEIHIQNVLKNNSVELTALIIKEQGNSLAPTIYLDGFYNCYKNGADLDELAEGMLETYENNKMNKIVNLDFIYKWELVKDSIVYKLVNTERNQGILDEIPHEEFLDLSKVFYLSLWYGEGSMLIRKEHCAMWGITEEELIYIAEKNTPKLFPQYLISMNEVMGELFENNMGKEAGEITEDFQMYILSNTSKRMGAAVVCYKNCLKMIAEKLQSDFYMIPSSIHEMLILPFTQEFAVKDLKEMVEEVNEMIVEKEEILGENVYLYKREQNELCIAE